MTPVRERRLNAALVVTTLVGLFAGGLAFLAGATLGADGEAGDASAKPDCYLVECEALTGLRRDEVTDLIGKPGGATARRWTFSAGVVNGYMGPGDANYLYVRFAPGGERVERAHLLYGGERALAD
jgi:hypothetical protein